MAFFAGGDVPLLIPGIQMSHTMDDPQWRALLDGSNGHTAHQTKSIGLYDAFHRIDPLSECDVDDVDDVDDVLAFVQGSDSMPSFPQRGTNAVPADQADARDGRLFSPMVKPSGGAHGTSKHDQRIASQRVADGARSSSGPNHGGHHDVRRRRDDEDGDMSWVVLGQTEADKANGLTEQKRMTPTCPGDPHRRTDRAYSAMRANSFTGSANHANVIQSGQAKRNNNNNPDNNPTNNKSNAGTTHADNIGLPGVGDLAHKRHRRHKSIGHPRNGDGESRHAKKDTDINDRKDDAIRLKSGRLAYTNRGDTGNVWSAFVRGGAIDSKDDDISETDEVSDVSLSSYCDDPWDDFNCGRPRVPWRAIGHVDGVDAVDDVDEDDYDDDKRQNGSDKTHTSAHLTSMMREISHRTMASAPQNGHKHRHSDEPVSKRGQGGRTDFVSSSTRQPPQSRHRHEQPPPYERADVLASNANNDVRSERRPQEGSGRRGGERRGGELRGDGRVSVVANLSQRQSPNAECSVDPTQEARAGPCQPILGFWEGHRRAFSLRTKDENEQDGKGREEEEEEEEEEEGQNEKPEDEEEEEEEKQGNAEKQTRVTPRQSAVLAGKPQQRLSQLDTNDRQGNEHGAFLCGDDAMATEGGRTTSTTHKAAGRDCARCDRLLKQPSAHSGRSDLPHRDAGRNDLALLTHESGLLHQHESGLLHQQEHGLSMSTAQAASELETARRDYIDAYKRLNDMRVQQDARLRESIRRLRARMNLDASDVEQQLMEARHRIEMAEDGIAHQYRRRAYAIDADPSIAPADRRRLLDALMAETSSLMEKAMRFDQEVDSARVQSLDDNEYARGNGRRHSSIASPSERRSSFRTLDPDRDATSVDELLHVMRSSSLSRRDRLHLAGGPLPDILHGRRHSHDQPDSKKDHARMTDRRHSRLLPSALPRSDRYRLTFGQQQPREWRHRPLDDDDDDMSSITDNYSFSEMDSGRSSLHIEEID